MNLMRKWAAYGLTCIVATIVWFSSTTAFGQPFVEVASGLPAVLNASVSWGDYDNDGDLDLLMAGDTGINLFTRIYRNDGGTFVDINAGLPGISEGAVVWADYNGDGYLDFGLTGGGTAALYSRIYRGNGNGTFTNINAALPPLEGSTLAWGDYDNDGDLDLFLTGYTGSAYVGAVYRNDGNDTFTDSGITTIRGGAAGSAAWSDFDNDGDLDLLFSAFTSDTSSGQSSRLYRNNNGAFTNITAISLTAMSYSSVAWGDYDNDGNLDILMAGSSISGVQSFPTLRLYHNNAGASFTSVSSGMTGAQNCSLAWGDYDNDGDLDVAIAGYNTSFAAQARIYVNLGSGFFFDTGTSITPVIDAALAWADYDGDGDLDLLVTGNSGSGAVTKLYRNDTFFGNSAPTPPWGLSSFVSGKTATLNWNAGSDANQPGGFTYNLRVGTSPGANNVVASMANDVTGFRRVPLLGNMSERLSWSLKLPVGGYYWSVQTIDHAFAGSAFDTEQYFEVPPQAPDVATLPATNITSSGVTLRGTANPNGDLTSFYFEYGPTTNYGSTTTPIDIGSGVTSTNVSDTLTGLLPATTYNFRAVAVNNYGVSYGTNRSFVTPIFVEVANTNFIGVGSGSIAWGDYNNDGYLDLLVAGGNSTGVVTRIYRNLSGTNFVEAVTNLAGINNGTVAWGDYDNDGDLDVLLTGNNTSRIYRNDSNDVFTDINAGVPNLSTGASAQWADFDNDGDLDFVLTGGGSGIVQLYRNDGNNQFVSLTNSLPVVNDSALSWADYDNDGDNDLLMTGYNFGAGGVSEMTRIYRNDGRGNFTNSNLSFQSLYRGATSWGDYDNDGDLDLLVCGAQFSTRYSMLYSNRNNGTFASVTISSVAKVDQGNISWGDYDNDGDLDILLVGQASTGAVARVYRNDITTFRDSGAVLPALGNVRAEWGDYDNDGRLDILMTGYTGSNYVTKLFHNVSLSANTPPSAPSSLVTTVTNNGALLSWSAATDSGQSGGLTYNLRVGTAPGSANVFSGMANESTGFRRLPKLGNANLRLNAVITNLSVGTYYWSVQAVDHAYAGSPFATEKSFVISPRAPDAVTGGATNITATSALLGGKANPNGLATTTYFEYGLTTNYGFRTATQNIGAGTSLLPVNLTATGLGIGTTNQFRLVASNSLGVVFGNNQSFATLPQFSELSGAITGLSGNYFGQWGDYDQDGDFDVLFTGFDGSANQLRAYRCISSNVFILETNASLAQVAGPVAWGDYDGDGDLDFAFSGGNSYNQYFSTLIYRNDGGGVFTNIAASLVGAASGTVNWVDYDRDGDLDLFVTGRDTAEGGWLPGARLYRNDGNGLFTPMPVPFPGVINSAVAWGDYDNDGWPDVLVTGNDGSTNLTKLFHNLGSGVFVEVALSCPGVQSGAVAWGDYDNDNDLDLLISGDTGSNYVSKVYRNNGSGSFTEIATPIPGLAASAAVWGDYDNDGDLDLLICGTTNGAASGNLTRVYRNDGGGVFANSSVGLPGISSGTAVWGDYDHDGDLDILLVGGNSAVRLLLNNQPTPDSLPTLPANLNSAVSGSRVALTWSAATDGNQSGGLTYNVRVGTSPGSGNIVSPQVNLTNGQRLLPQMGNAGHRLALTLTNLAVGTYYWSVQAVDHTFVGSAFPGELNFVIPPRAPDAISLPATNVTFNSVTLLGLANPNGLAATAYFQFGTTTNYGSATTAQNVGNGTATIGISAPLNSLIAGTTYHFRAVVSNSLGIAYGTNQSVTAPQFTEIVSGLPGFNFASQPVWGDFDNDGIVDLFVSSQTGNSVFRGAGDGTFTNIGVTFGGGSVACGDLDNDGDLDLLVAGSTATYLYRNNGSNSFTEINLGFAATYAATAIAVGDFDNDGDLDFVWASNGATRLYRNEGGLQFSNTAISLTGVHNGSLSWADFDNDGDLDLLLTGSTSVNNDALVTQLYRNDNAGAFTLVNTNFPGAIESSLAWADYDRDGRLDLLMTGTSPTGSVALVFHNDGSGTFHDIGAGLAGVYRGSARWGDYDNDGNPDIFFSGIRSGLTFATKVLRNNGNHTFTDLNLSLAPNDSYVMGEWADYDNDGDLDLLCIGGNSYMSRLFRNNSTVANIPPSAPWGLTSSRTGSAVTLNWSAASDANQAGGLSYNLSVGTLPGISDTLSPAANLTNGWRRLPQLGNVQQNLHWTLTNLPPGTFYWRVQSVDNALAGSPFSTNASFVVPPRAPDVVALPHSNLTVTGVTLAGRVNPNGAGTVAYFQYGLTTNYGSLTSPQDAGSGVSLVTLTAALTGLNYTTTYHYRLVASNSFGLRIGPDQTFMTPQFTELDPGLPATPGALAAVDFDNDNDLDVAMTIHISAPTAIYRNNGGLVFTNIGASLPPLNFATLDWGDYDRDGDLDLVLTGFHPSWHYTTRIFRNEGSNVFTDIGAALQNVTGAARWGDFDNDGDLDVLITSWLDGAWYVYRNNGSGQFALFQSSNSFGGFGIWADYDNDSDLDFLVSGTDPNGNPHTALYRNDGAAGFVSSGLALPDLRGQAAWGDYDNDGDLDLLLCGGTSSFAGSPSETHLYRNDGGGNFTEIPTALPNMNANIVWADLDNDGDLDIVLTGQDNWPHQGVAFRNDGNGVFTDLGANFLPAQGSGLAVGDFDQDGDLDFFMAGYPDQSSSYATRFYRNNCPTPNTPPNAPTGLTATISSNGVRLSWSPATDANQTGGLSYNLRVGTTPGGSDVVSPAAAPNGSQRVPRMGNVQENLSWSLTNLTAGTYYWSVQAVDNSYAGSVFAPEATVSTNSIPNTAPIANPQLVIMGEDTLRSITLTASDAESQPLTYSVTATPTNGVLTGTPPNLSYRPKTNFFGADRFLFQAHDGFTNSLPATVSLIVTQVHDVAYSTLTIQKTNGPPRVTLTGEPFERYQLEASTDLIHWVALTNVVSTNGIMAVIDADAASYPKRFYRAALSLPPANINSPQRSPGGAFQFNFAGELARRYEIQASTNLVNWISLTNVLLTTSPVTFTDPTAPSHPHRFYRVQPLP